MQGSPKKSTVKLARLFWITEGNVHENWINIEDSDIQVSVITDGNKYSKYFILINIQFYSILAFY